MTVPKFTTRRLRPTWGSSVVGRLVCGQCGCRDLGQVRRDRDGRDWLAVTSHRWRVGMATRGPAGGNRPDLYDMHDLDAATEARAWCHRCAAWASVDLDAARAAIRTAAPTHPARLIVNAQPER